MFSLYSNTHFNMLTGKHDSSKLLRRQMRRSPQGALLKEVSTCEKKLEEKSMERENYHKIKSILRRRVPKKAVNTKEPFESSKGLKTGTGTWRESKVDKHSRRMKNSIHRHRIVIYRSNISLAWFHKYVFFPFFSCALLLYFSSNFRLMKIDIFSFPNGFSFSFRVCLSRISRSYGSVPEIK